MKILGFVFGLLMAQSVFAQTEILSGYINTSTTGELYFVSVDAEAFELTGVWPLNVFTDKQVKSMYKCMDKKTTHVIQVDKIPNVQRNVPTGIPGRTTTTHFPSLENIRCVRQDGFLYTWRAIVSRSKFR